MTESSHSDLLSSGVGALSAHSPYRDHSTAGSQYDSARNRYTRLGTCLLLMRVLSKSSKPWRVEKEAPLTALQSATSLASYTRRCISRDHGAFPSAVVCCRIVSIAKWQTFGPTRIDWRQSKVDLGFAQMLEYSVRNKHSACPLRYVQERDKLIVIIFATT